MQVFEKACVVGKATGGVIVHPNGEGIAVEMNKGGSLLTSPIGLESQADSLVFGNSWEPTPLLEEEVNSVLNATTNLECCQGESPEVSLGLGVVCVFPCLPRTNWPDLALLPVAWTRSSLKGEAGNGKVSCQDFEKEG